MSDPILQIGPRITALPVVHGSGDFAWEVRRWMLAQQYDCVVAPLPPSFQQVVCDQVSRLPSPSIVVQRDEGEFGSLHWTPGQDRDEEMGIEPEHSASYVPIDPCQPVISAIRTALGERIPIRFIDLETPYFEPNAVSLPDAWALKRVSIQQYAAAVLPFLKAPDHAQWRDRVRHMARQLRELSIDFQNILFVCSILDWPWIRQEFHNPDLQHVPQPAAPAVTPYRVPEQSLYFLLGEMPFITSIYERARAELEDDRTIGIDGVKELLIAARTDYLTEFKGRARRITPKLLDQMLRYARNLTLMDRCFTPQLPTIVTAAKQVAGDGYAIAVLEKAKTWDHGLADDLDSFRLGIGRGQLPDGTRLRLANRLPGPPVTWTRLKLVPRPDEKQKKDWQQRWNPWSQCSWPPEDEVIENFRQAVFDRAREVMGADLVRTEKFTTSIRDGIDIRDTLRNWYKGDIHVKVLPPARGKLDSAVMLFDSPADPRQYPWRTTWFAEHKNESTLAFYATNFADTPVGPGICMATYGGAMFVYPPVAIPDIWQDSRLDFAETLEERLLGAACLHSTCPHIALVSSGPPGPAWRKLARHFKKAWVWLPLARFSDSTVQQLRMVHVLNGKHIRSYAAQFIRKV